MKSRKFIIMAFMIAMNFVLGTIVTTLKVPFVYLDTTGTIFTAALFGPVAAIIVGLLTNFILIFSSGSLITGVFGIVNATVGLVSGLIFKKWGVNYVTAIATGIILAFVAPMIGTPISLYFYGGLDFNASDFVKVYFDKLIDNFAYSVYIEKVLNNLIDKIFTSLLVVFIYIRLNFKERFNDEAYQ